MPKKPLSPVEQIWAANPKCKPSPEAMRKFLPLGDELVIMPMPPRRRPPKK
jgi:hypothetical protein